ncbi:fibronectin type III domain-containing protein [Flavobacterium agricola]|uniref:Fibronectin type III domain-containing protein n=1 Tax=Flavobacterium agricola TaxID=2870839 RepID=A0ABY6LZU9_9FLAO|nr:fibronectin type III domain-containing protein [Flavobacterium agricola]UYW01819.1 fibronectin type III domain-containing protein [Flavobacterium agricola]
MTRYIKQIIVLLFVCLCQTLCAQIYPVQAIPTVYSPYSNKISDYSNPLVNRINLQLITTDLAVQNRQVQLFLKIQGNGITAQSTTLLSGTLPIYINGGEINNLSSNELSSYFRFQNLQGLSTTQYSEPLPDGLYTICFQVYDLATRKWLSQNSCATMYLMLNDPPQLNLPANNEQIASTTFPNINFSWTPRHLNATNVSYTFEIKEILNATLDPAFAFETSRLLYKEEDLRTTNLLYDLSKPTLIPGKRYAWRIKAISTNGLAENNVFKNNGYSQINYFTYASTCEAPKYLLSEQQGNNRVKIMWDGINAQQRYHIQYKKANTPNAQWFDTYTVNTQTLLTDLEPGYTYEFRVGATCEPTQYGITQSYTYSGIQTFTINKNEKATAYNCGIVPTIEIRNQQPLGAMVINETFMAGDFPVKVLDVQGGNGMFSGSGYIQVPYLADTRIGVTFTNIRINADYQMLDGVVETTYDPNWGNVDFIDDLWDVNQQDIAVNFPIESIDFENGEIIVTGPNGQTETFPGGKDTIITGSDNKNYYVDANGKVTGPFDTAKGGKPTPENTDGVNKNGQAIAYTAEGIRVVFEKNNDTQYAFDPVAYNKELTSDYKKIGDTFVPFKAVPNGLTDKLLAKVTIADSKINADSLFFKTQNGVEIKADRIGNDFVLNLEGAQKFAIEEVQATIKQGDKYKIAGVFNLVHVSPKTVNLKLIPTEGVSISDKQIDEIKAIYNQLAINIDIEVVPEFGINNYLVGGVLPTEDVFGDLSKYSPIQSKIISDYKSINNIEEAYYIFVTDKVSSTGQSGYMKLNGQFGFVFDQQPTTIAHELAHGAFKLEHPFKKYKNKGVNQGATQNLMDYAQGTELFFTDWKQINDPAFKLYAFQSQSDGEFSEIHLTPDWEPFLYSGSSTYAYDLKIERRYNGAVYGIEKDNKTYEWNDKLKKYINNDNDSLNIPIKKDIKDTDIVYLYWYTGQGCGYNLNYSISWEAIKSMKETFVTEMNKATKSASLNKLVLVGNIPCEVNNIQIGNFRYKNKCVNMSVSEIDKVKAKFSNLKDVKNLDNIVNEILTTDYCYLAQLDYEMQEWILDILIEDLSNLFDNNKEFATVKILNAVYEQNYEKIYQFFSANGNAKLKRALKKISNAKIGIFGDNNLNDFVETLSFQMSKINSNQNKWNVTNCLIKGKYDDVQENYLKVALETLLSSIDQSINSTNIDVFTEMLNDDCETLVNYEIVFEISKLRIQNKELFNQFTQGDKIKLLYENATFYGYGNLTCSVNKPSLAEKWSWILPGRFSISCSDQSRTEFMPFDLHKYFEWSKYLKDNPSTEAKYQSDLLEFVTVFKNQFENYIQTKKSQKENFWNSISNIDCNKISEIVNHININENGNTLKEVEKSKRLNIITTYFSCSNTSLQTVGYTNNDHFIIKLLSSFDKTDMSIVATLETIGFKNITSSDKLSNKTIYNIIMWLSGQLHYTNNLKELKKENLLKSDGILKDSDSMLKLESDMLKFDNLNAKFTSKNKLSLEGNEVDYNQKVVVYVSGSFTFADQNFKQGQVLEIPAIQAFALSSSNNDIVTEKSIWTAVDVATFVIGIGEVKVLFTAGNYIRKAIVISDIAGSTMGITSQLINEDYLSPDARFKLQMLSIVASAPQILTSFKKVDNLITTLDDDINRINNIAAKNEVKSYFSKVKSRLNISDDLKNIPHFKSLETEELKKMFLQDFNNRGTNILNNLNKENSEIFNAWLKFRKNSKTKNKILCN